MKTKISRIGKRTLSLVLTMIMVVSMMLVGMVAVNAAASAFPNSLKIFVDVGTTGFNNDNATIDAYFFGTSGNTWVKMDNQSGTIFTCLTPSTGTYEKVIFSRSSNHACDFDKDWNQTADIAYASNTNKCKLTGSVSSTVNGSWSLTTMNWYLSGTLDGYDTGNTSTDYVMSHTSNGVYTFEKTFTSSTGGYQYVTVNDGYNSYHPATSNSSSGTVGSKLGVNGGNDPKWRVSAGYGDTVTFTWNSFTRVLSWEIDSGDTPTTYTVLKGNVTNGTLSFNKTTAAAGTEITITATPNAGYELATLTATDANGNAVTITNNKFTMPSANVTVSATFEAVWYLSGAITKSDDTQQRYINYEDEEFRMLQSSTDSNIYTYTYEAIGRQYATINGGHVAYHPTANTTDPGAADLDKCNIAPTTEPSWWSPEFTEATTITYTWNAEDKTLTWSTGSEVSYDVSVDSSVTDGTITVDPTNAAEGDQITVTVSPEEGYTCSGVTYTYNGSGHIANGSGNTYTFNMPASDVTVSATFEKEVVSGEYTIALNTSTKGKIAYTNNTSTDIKTGTANANDEITVTVTPNRGYKFTGLTVNSLAVEATDNGEGTYTYTFTVSENVTIEASYESTVALYTLTGSVSNATVTFSTQTSASVKSSEAGQKITVTVTPKSGYKCSSISVLDSNGVEIAVENLGSTKCSFIMPECDVTVEAVIEEYTSDPNHTFTVYFKAPSAYAYTPKVFLDGASTPVAMTYHKTLGKTYSGALTMCWFTCQLTVDTSTTHTLTFKTERTKLNATITDNFINDTYYLAVDNLMNGTEVVDLSAMPEYVQNYYRSATHMVYPYTGVAEDTDKTLGFTNYNGERKRMGSVVIDGRETVSIKSATLMQQVAAKITTVSDTQADLLDVNLDGVVDVRDATLTQKYLVGM